MSDQLFLPARRRRHRAATGATTISLAALIATSLVLPAQAAGNPAPAASATLSGGSGTVTSAGTLYASQGATVILTVDTTGAACVDVSGAFTGHETSSTAKSTWTFTTTASAGDGARAVTVVASEKFNGNGVCTGQSASVQASYTLDNTGPVVTGSLTPAPNPAGWNKADVGIAWSASDAGSGVGSGPAPATDSVNADTSGVTKTSTATDRLGNTGSGSVVVKLDETAPSIDATRSPAANAAGWHNTDVTVGFTCSDSLSGIKSCTGGGTVVLSTEGANQSVPGTAVDNADNTNTAGVIGINIDKTAPTLTGTPTTAANGFDWYKDDVTIGWNASDALSGLANGEPENSTITGEGASLKATATVGDKAGNTTTADSAPVKIDRTAPATALSGTSNNWTNGDVTVDLSGSDNLSGVASTSYSIDGGEQRTGTSFTLSNEGDHTVTFFSTDKAGNVEKPQTAHVKIDKTAPTIGHSFTPLSYTDGAWTNQDVTVTFNCADTGSGVASCTTPVTTSAEGAGQQVVGTATDQAGNSASDTAVVSIDKTPPTVTAAPDRAANDNGWYNDDVTVTFSATDALSGITGTSPAEVLGEGTNQSAAGTATDAAGNSGSATVTGINIDKTAPVLTGSFDGGWHTGDVVVHWSCTDSRSGVATGPADETVTGEGDNLSSTATCTDKAGNTATKTVSGVKIDRTAPTTTADVPDPLASGWYADAVKVTLTGHDELSGIGATYYSVDGGEPKTYTGAFDFTAKGTHTIRYWSTDAAGNTEDAADNSITLKIDGNPPTTTVINPISPDTGWFVTSGIPVAFEANDAESGIAATYYQIDDGARQTYGEPFTADLSDGSHTITYWSVDLAGNTETKKSTQVNVDTIAPTITAAIVSGTKGSNGWYVGPVGVHFTCADTLSGIATCPDDVTLTDDGANSATGRATDKAGNSATATLADINIDQELPEITKVNVAGGTYVLGAVPAATCEATDTHSGPAGCTVTVAGGKPNGVGTFTYTATATDKAGNTRTEIGTYKVIYRFDGYLQPINDTAHQVGLSTSVFKAGSTVPAKFQLKKADGTVVQANTAPTWSTPIKGSAMSLPVDESVYSASADSGSTYRYDTTAQQYIHNWKTSAGGNYWRIGVTLDDGQTYYVNIGLRN